MQAPQSICISVISQHNDNNRTGANLHEVILNISNVYPERFGKLFTRQVDGQIYAQPLLLCNVSITGQGIHNVIYVATMHNTVYAFDADDPNASVPLWEANLGPSITLPDPNIGPEFDALDLYHATTGGEDALKRKYRDEAIRAHGHAHDEAAPKVAAE